MNKLMLYKPLLIETNEDLLKANKVLNNKFQMNPNL